MLERCCMWYSSKSVAVDQRTMTKMYCMCDPWRNPLTKQTPKIALEQTSMLFFCTSHLLCFTKYLCMVVDSPRNSKSHNYWEAILFYSQINVSARLEDESRLDCIHPRQGARRTLQLAYEWCRSKLLQHFRRVMHSTSTQVTFSQIPQAFQSSECTWGRRSRRTRNRKWHWNTRDNWFVESFIIFLLFDST